jgi:hypothetical protein
MWTPASCYEELNILVTQTDLRRNCNVVEGYIHDGSLISTPKLTSLQLNSHQLSEHVQPL